MGRISDIMKEKGLTDVSRVGLYGLTYKENVDDTRESPTLQMLECMERHLASGVKVYDPLVSRISFPVNITIWTRFWRMWIWLC